MIYKIFTNGKHEKGSGIALGIGRNRYCLELERGHNAAYPHIGGDPMEFGSFEDAEHFRLSVVGIPDKFETRRAE